MNKKCYCNKFLGWRKSVEVGGVSPMDYYACEEQAKETCTREWCCPNGQDETSRDEHIASSWTDDMVIKEASQFSDWMAQEKKELR